MDAVRKPLGYLLCALGLILLAQFLAFPFYSRDNLALALDIWSYINIASHCGAIIAVAVAFVRWRGYDRSNLREAVGAGGMFMFAAAFAIMNAEQSLSALWLLQETEDGPQFREFRELLWIAIDVTFPVLMGWVGSWLLRSEQSSLPTTSTDMELDTQ